VKPWYRSGNAPLYFAQSIGPENHFQELRASGKNLSTMDLEGVLGWLMCKISGL
jgi:hypothetical protein